jgi:hypothetical protein
MSKNQNSVTVVQNSKVAELLKLLSAEKGGLRLAKQAIREQEQAERKLVKQAKEDAEKAEQELKSKIMKTMDQVKAILKAAGFCGTVIIDMAKGEFKVRRAMKAKVEKVIRRQAEVRAQA